MSEHPQQIDRTLRDTRILTLRILLEVKDLQRHL